MSCRCGRKYIIFKYLYVLFYLLSVRSVSLKPFLLLFLRNLQMMRKWNFFFARVKYKMEKEIDIFSTLVLLRSASTVMMIRSRNEVERRSSKKRFGECCQREWANTTLAIKFNPLLGAYDLKLFPISAHIQPSTQLSALWIRQFAECRWTTERKVEINFVASSLRGWKKREEYIKNSLQ